MVKSRLYFKARLSGSKVTLKYEGEICEFSMHVTKDVAESDLLAHTGASSNKNAK